MDKILKRIYTLDPHSDVTAALIPNLVIIDNAFFHESCIFRFLETDGLDRDTAKLCIVSPDAGAQKKIYSAAKHISKCFCDHSVDVLTASKHRDTKTGAITSTDVPLQELDPETGYIIFDDICDGGRTFIELAKAMRQKGARHLGLAVTHGIFSNGFDVLREHFNFIRSTNSISSHNIRTNCLTMDFHSDLLLI